LRTTVQPPVTSASVRTETYREFAKDDYLNAVRKAKEYIAAGELMQVQVGQRLVKPFRDNPLSLYRALRSLNPSPYMYYYNFGGEFHVVGASPEILVRQEKRSRRPNGLSPFARWPARGRAATRRNAMPNSRPNC
jgi:anthranilate synthase component 1